jgi:rhodanese-related sulfurtransferase
MAYTEKFQALADAAIANVRGVPVVDVDTLVAAGAIALDIRDKEEHDLDHIAGSLHCSRGKLEMNVEDLIPNLEQVILCYCNANNRGALSASTLKQMGYQNAKFIAGGLKAYRGLPDKSPQGDKIRQ